jgi:hypothetical protein
MLLLNTSSLRLEEFVRDPPHTRFCRTLGKSAMYRTAQVTDQPQGEGRGIVQGHSGRYGAFEDDEDDHKEENEKERGV